MPRILIKQRDITDCGAACLASIAAHYRLNIPVAKVRQYAGTDKHGTTIQGLHEAASKLNFEAKGVKGLLSSLGNVPLPAIAHLIANEQLQHFVVIYKVTKKHILIMDPGDGKMHRKKLEIFAEEWTGVLLLLIPNESFKIGNEKINHLNRFWQLIIPHKKIMLQALFGSAMYTILGLSTSIFIQKITDIVLVEDNRSLLHLLSIMMIVILGFQTFIGMVKNVFIMRIGQQIDANLILGYYKHLLKLPQQFFDTMRIGEIISRTNDAVKIRALINEVAINFTINLMIIIFAFLLMFTYYWKLALLMLTVIPIYLVIYLIINKLNKKIQRRLMEQSAELESHFVETLNAINTVKHFQLEEYNITKTETLFISLLKTIYLSGKNTIFSGVSVEFFSHLLTITLLWIGSIFSLDGEITAGELFSFYTLIGFFTGPAGTLIGTNKTFQDAIIASDRLFEIMDLEIENNSAKINLTPELLGDIQFRNVNFKYGSRAPIFEQLCMTIKKGSFTAIVGESGSGKSTLMSLLQNNYPLQKGDILIGEYSINYLNNKSLRKIISIVPQHLDLFSGSLMDNIALGEYEPDLQQIIEICTKLGMLNFIERLPQGFHTYLGENGTLLSGGEKQRIAIARALYRKPEILILDEATSSLDPIAERFVKQTVDFLIEQQKTIIVIAHRLSTINLADHIIVLHDGSVVEEGTHQELILNHRYYYELWEKQFGRV